MLLARGVPGDVPPAEALTVGKIYEVPEALMNRIYNTLQFYANETSYLPPRIGGVVAGCPRGPAPTPIQLTMNARFIVREIDRDLLKRIQSDTGVEHD
jgi:hypothetical protein